MPAASPMSSAVTRSSPPRAAARAARALPEARRPTGRRALLSTTPPPVRHRPGRLLGRYPFLLGQRQDPSLGGFPFRLLDLLASALDRTGVAHPHLRW